jgi:two-component system, cell cycle sensor histidine kinase and response regulator CckA
VREVNIDVLKKKLNQSIRSRFLIVMSCILFAGTVLISFIIARNEDRVLMDSLMSKGQSLASYIATICSDPLIMNDAIKLDDIVMGAARDDNVLYAVIYDVDGIPASSRYASINYSLPSVHSILLEVSKDSELQDIINTIKKKESIVEVSHIILLSPSTVNTRIIGKVIIGLSSRNVHHEFIKTLLFIVALNVLLAVILIVVLCLISNKMIFDPLHDVADASYRIAKGDLSTEVKIHTIGEIKILVDSFNSMVRNLEKVTVSKDYVDNIINSMINTVVVASSDNIIVKANAATCRLLGYEEEELIGRSAKFVFSKAGSNRHSWMNVMFAEGRIGNIEERYCRKDGREVPVLLSASVMRDLNNLIQGMVYVAQDISGRKRAEEETRQTNSYLENILENSPDCIAIVDKHGKFVRWNKMAADLYGYTFEDMKGKPAYDLYADKDELEKMLMSLRREGSVKKWEMRMQKKDGSIVPFEISIGLLKDSQDETLGSVCVARDLSGIKEALAALKASHEQLYREIAVRIKADKTVERLRRRNELILNSAGEGILGLDTEGRHTFVNPAATRMLGYMADELIGRKGHELYHHTGEDGEPYPEEDCPVVQAFRYGKFRQVSEEVFWRKDGTSFPVRYSSAPIIEQDTVMGAVITFRDITESKRGEKERKKLEEQLYQAQKMESVGRLAGGVAHDFNNMLGVIIGRAEMALEHDVPTDKLQHNLKEILKAGLRSADLTRQLLAFARKQTAIPRIVDLNDTISGMLKMLRRLIGEDIELIWEQEHDLWKIKIDPSQVDQILANLVVNSRDAISGIGTITMNTENVVIYDSTRADTPEFIPGEYVLLTVSDTGAGMSREVCENIFEPFFTTKELGKGTGLGLSTVYGIVKQNDGFIYVASEPGNGAAFKIYLPRFKVETASVPSEEIPGKRATGAETILLVEDDEAILNLSKMILENLGYTVLAGHTPVDAIRLAEEHPGDLDLLITDVVMPEMNGRELAEKLSAFIPNLKCLYMSGYTADLIAHRGILDEGVNFIQKPFLSDDLAAKVRRVLDHLG